MAQRVEPTAEEDQIAALQNASWSETASARAGIYDLKFTNIKLRQVSWKFALPRGIVSVRNGGRTRCNIPRLGKLMQQPRETRLLAPCQNKWHKMLKHLGRTVSMCDQMTARECKLRRYQCLSRVFSVRVVSHFSLWLDLSQALFDQLDRNRDGVLSREEFLHIQDAHELLSLMPECCFESSTLHVQNASASPSGESWFRSCSLRGISGPRKPCFGSRPRRQGRISWQASEIAVAGKRRWRAQRASSPSRTLMQRHSLPVECIKVWSVKPKHDTIPRL